MSGGFEDIWYSEADVVKLENDLAIERIQSEYYREAYSDSARALLAAEDIGWSKLGVSADLKQITLDSAKQVAEKLSGYTESNPLLARGKEIRCSYLFNAPYKIGTEGADTKVTPQQKNIIDKQKNQDSVFSMAALERIEGERYNAGQVFVLFDRGAKTFQQISFQEIGDIIYNPNDATDIWYVQRSWSANVIKADGSVVPQDFKEYYPASTYTPDGSFATKIKDVSVVQGKRMIVDRVNVKPGGNLGIPDAFAAAPWALAYSAYLRDGSKVLAALAEFTWLVKPKKRPAAEVAAASMRNERQAGGTLFTDADVQAMPTRNAIDLETGRPLAAQVAAALGISLVVLVPDPSQGGSYNAAASLSDPNRRTMEARRERNSEFLKHCLTLIGVKDPEITWDKMSPGSDKEETEIVMQAWGSGMFDVDEIRPRLAELGHIQILHDDAPEGVIIPNNEKSLEKASKLKQAETESAAKAAASVKPDGSTEMSNGQGRDSLGVGNMSHTTAASGERGTKSSRTNS